MYTFQDFEEAVRNGNKLGFIASAIQEHKGGPLCRMARDADLYDRQLNVTINNYVKTIFTLTGSPVEDFTASNSKLASNFFHRLNTQRCTYSLGNGLSFTRKEERVDETGKVTTVDLTKEALGPKFDTDFQHAGYLALIHGVSFCFWNVNRVYVFPLTNFVPLWDEYKGTLRAGIRFWRLAPDKPIVAVLYEEDGYAKYQSTNDSDISLVEVQSKKVYKTNVQFVPADGQDEVVGEENYGVLPIVPFWGSRLHQSTLVGMKHKIDSYDLIHSGFANDLTDCAQIYWILENCSGMTDKELARFRDRLKVTHVASADTSNGGKITPYTQEIPYQARKTYLDDLRASIYEDFGGLDVHTVAAGATNDHIDAAYQPMDENADDFEFQAIECVQQILSLMGIEDTPIFKRNRISNQKEQVDMVIAEAPYLDDETILQKLPNISPDEIQDILARRDAASQNRMEDNTNNEDEEDTENPFSGPEDEGEG